MKQSLLDACSNLEKIIKKLVGKTKDVLLNPGDGPQLLLLEEHVEELVNFTDVEDVLGMLGSSPSPQVPPAVQQPPVPEQQPVQQEEHVQYEQHQHQHELPPPLPEPVQQSDYDEVNQQQLQLQQQQYDNNAHAVHELQQQEQEIANTEALLSKQEEELLHSQIRHLRVHRPQLPCPLVEQHHPLLLPQIPYHLAERTPLLFSNSINHKHHVVHLVCN